MQRICGIKPVMGNRTQRLVRKRSIPLVLLAGEGPLKITAFSPKLHLFFCDFEITLPVFVNYLILYLNYQEIDEKGAKNPHQCADFCLHLFHRCKLVGVPGFEPGASWTRRFGSNFKGSFPARLVLFIRGAVAFQTSPLQCLHPLPAQSGSPFGSALDCTG